MKVAIAGASGLIGRAVARAATAAGHHTVDLPRFDVIGGAPSDTGRIPYAARRWISERQSFAEGVGAVLDGAEVVVNATGAVDPAGTDRTLLMGVNALLPAILGQLAATSGVRRMIHLSSSAVQQRMPYLDETRNTRFLTPYAESKAAAEWTLLDSELDRPDEMIIYRPTSVQATERSITRKLVALASRRVLPVSGSGDAPLPLCLLDNVSAGILHMVESPVVAPIVLQPWEGLTARVLFTLIGDNPVLIRIPRGMGRMVLAVGYLAGKGSVRAAAVTQNLEVLFLGKEQRADVLYRLGFRAPVGLQRYRELADEIRESAAERDRGPEA